MKPPCKIALALGGGAARGYAHIGVLQVLEEHGIPIDYIAGCSMGALVGALYATGISANMLHNVASQIGFSEALHLFDITLPRFGLVRGQRVEALMRTLTGNRNIEQLARPFACICVSLEDSTLHTITSGNVAKAVRASISIPGVFDPVVIDGKHYVDGGVLCRVPTAAARAMGGDFILAVDVGYHGEPRDNSPRNVIDIIMWSFEIMEWQMNDSWVRDSDLLVKTNTHQINPANFANVDEVVQLGREAMERRIDELKEALRSRGIDI